VTTSEREKQLSALSAFVASALGLNFPEPRWGELERQAILAATELGFDDLAAFLPWLLSAAPTRKQIETLAGYLTISETYFWREPQTFEALRDPILRGLIRQRETQGRRLRIWSAGCSTGEEAYSLAILLYELIPAPEDWHITLLATDINPDLLRRAALGVYDEWSFRNAPLHFRDRYFSQRDDGRFELIPQIRKMVTFAYLNLAEDSYPSAMNHTNGMDLILCRNVLMYFVAERAQQARQRFFNALVEGGWLVVAASELSQEKYAQFAAVRFPGTFAYQRPAASPHAVSLLELVAAQKMPIVPGRLAPQSSPAHAGPATPATPATPAKVPASSLTLLVRDLADQGKLSEALFACDQAMAAGRLDPGLHYLHAIMLQEQKRDEEAKAALKRALYLDPSFVLAHFALGSLARRRGQSLAAQKSFRTALELLEASAPDDIVPEADGLTAGRLREAVHQALETGDLKW
jgi:chemotaxis protein methyltransferase CheR